MRTDNGEGLETRAVSTVPLHREVKLMTGATYLWASVTWRQTADFRYSTVSILAEGRPVCGRFGRSVQYGEKRHRITLQTTK